jgi:hypothetical protein
MKKLLLILFVLLVFCVSAYSETLTLSTYYPAPFGSYDRLRLVPRTTAGLNCAGMDGLMVYDTTISPASVSICSGGTWVPLADRIWSRSGTNIILTTASDNVGIGINPPTQKLDVSGNTRISGSLNAGTTITAGTGITATTGSITATTGNVAAGDAVTAGTTVTAGTGVTSTTGNITATAGNISATNATNGIITGRNMVANNTLSVTGTSTLTGNVGMGRAPHASYDADVNGDALVRGNLRLGNNEGILRVGYTASAPPGYYAVYAP